MLVIDGALHPAFIVNSNDRKPRNGVGVSSPTEVHFVITKGWVNFYEFARFFRDGLGCRNALFLDGGEAPGLYAPELGRNDRPAMAAMGLLLRWWSRGGVGGFLSTAGPSPNSDYHKMFMIEGVVLNSSSAMQEPVTASLPSPCSPQRNRRSPVPPVGASSFRLNGRSNSWGLWWPECPARLIVEIPACKK